MVGLVVGKFVGVFGSAAVLRLLRVGEFGPGLTLDRIAGGAALCGIGFTISLFIVDLAIDDPDGAEPGAGRRARGIRHRLRDRDRDLPRLRCRSAPTSIRARRSPVRSTRSAITCSAAADAPYTIVEYGDFQCGFCLKASGSIQEVHERARRRPPLRLAARAARRQYHPNALAGAEAAEAASLQGKFFEFERGLFADQENQRPSDIIRLARELGLDVEKFERDLTSPEVTGRVRDDMLDAEAMGITSVPTLFINGRRHTGPYDAQSLIRALSQPDQGPQPVDPTTAPTR